MSIDWKEIAPKRKDWEALTEKFIKAGLMHNWINGVPVFLVDVIEDQILALLSGTQTKPTKKKKK